MNLVQYAAALAVILSSNAAWSAETTYINGPFEGCSIGRTYRLQNGQVLTCREDRFGYSYRPRVVIDRSQITIERTQIRADIAWPPLRTGADDRNRRRPPTFPVDSRRAESPTPPASPDRSRPLDFW